MTSHNEEEKIKRVFGNYESCSEHEVHMSDELNSANELERYIKWSISDKPCIKSSDVYDVVAYDVPHYEGREIMDDDKSCPEPEVLMSGELNSADEQKGRERIDDDTSCSEPEVLMSGELNSADEQKSLLSPVVKESFMGQDYKTLSHELADTMKGENDLREQLKFSKEESKQARRKILALEQENETLKLQIKKLTNIVLPKTGDDKKVEKEEMSSENLKILLEMMEREMSVLRRKVNETEKENENLQSEVKYLQEKVPNEPLIENNAEKRSLLVQYTINKSNECNPTHDFKKKMKRKSSPDEFEIELSEYEKMVQKNRDEKLAFLQSLKMDEVKESLNQAIGNLKPKRPPRRSNTESVSTPQGPTRNLPLRLAKVDINLSEKALAKRPVVEFEKEIKEKLSPILTFEEAIKEGDVYTDYVRDFDYLDFKTPKPFTDYMSCFKNMKIDKSKIAEVINGRLTAMAIHPMKEKVIVAAGNNCGAISFWHGTSDSGPYVFEPHLSGVSCLKFNADSLNQIISCSLDGTMRCGDMEKRVFNEVFNISEETSCNYFDFISPTTTLVCHRNGNVSLVDLRSYSKSAEKSHKCHKYPVKTVSIHPVKRSYFVSADLKGFLSLWDLRKLQKKPVRQLHRQRTVIQSAFFSPVTGNSILTTSSADDSLILFNSSELGRPLRSHIKRRYNLQKIFKGTWLPNTDDAFVIGSLEYPRRIKILNKKLRSIYNFQDIHLDTITSTHVFHPSLPVLACGNTSGKVYIFS